MSDLSIKEDTAILIQVNKELVAFLVGGKLTLANITSVTLDLYNFILSFKTLKFFTKFSFNI